MARTTLNAAAKTAGYSLGGAGIVCLIGSILIGMLILSLLPIYLSNDSDEGYGEIYTIQGFTIKLIYTNLIANFTGGNVISLAGLSSLCTAIFRANNVKDFYACVARNFTAYGPTSNSTLIRRRALDDAALYEIGDMQIIFWNTCANKRALTKWYSDISRKENSSCVARRATACRSFITTPNQGNLANPNQWLPFPNSYTQLVVTNTTGCAAIAVSKIYNVNYYNYANVYDTSSNKTRPAPLHPDDCQYSSIISQANLRGLVSNQTNTNVSTCSSIIG